MPCELRLRTWLPAMPAYTEWISQPAMSSASSTARWMDCTVDSMLTTTPFFRPREGWLPMPMISSAPSALISPTMATTLLVPMSSPTIKLRSERFAMSSSGFLQASESSECLDGADAGVWLHCASRWQSHSSSACPRR